MNKKDLKYGLIIILFIGLSSCQIQKEFVAPQLEDVSNYRNNSAIDSTTFGDVSWWEIFNDSILVALVEEGLNNNLTLKNTVSLIKQSQLQLDIA
jgi:multidrug efflux system outer membrane protein